MLIKRIRLTNLLSFGPDTEELDLAPLNVLIGPNGSGKSNLGASGFRVGEDSRRGRLWQGRDTGRLTRGPGRG